MAETINISNVPFNILDAVVCPVTLNSLANGTYSGTPIPIQILKGIEITVESTELDPLTDRGQAVALASVVMMARFTLSMAGVDFNAVQVVGGQIAIANGTAPAHNYQVYPEAGGSGLPYFGMIIKGAVADAGDSIYIGLPLCKLATQPSVSINENDWTMTDIEGSSIVNRSSALPQAPYFAQAYNQAFTMPTDAAGFNSFFGVS